MDINSYVAKRTLDQRSLITLEGYPINNIYELLAETKRLKTMHRFGEKIAILDKKSAVLLTKHRIGYSRIAFEMAMATLGGNAITLSLGGEGLESFLNSSESLRVIPAYGISAIVVDTLLPSDAQLVATQINLPVINANGADSPCKALAAIFSLWEAKGSLNGLKLCCIADYSKSVTSFLSGIAKCGADITVVAPTKLQPSNEVADYCKQFSDFYYSDNLLEGLKNADAVFCEHDFGKEYLINEANLAVTNDAFVLHNIPVDRDKEICELTLSSPRSLVIAQGENLMFTEMAALSLTIGGKELQ